ncbi:MAG: hypothetical protein Q9Q13_03235 [Acidobacteriota bacterium]|nr:hypothetical protein [Acidobacteriota bacterium]
MAPVPRRHRCSGEFAVTGHLYVQNAGATGTLWIDVTVRPSAPRSAYPLWRMLFAAGWGATALYCATFLGLWRRFLGLAVIANALVIVIGLTAPEGVLQKAAEEQIILADTVRQALPEFGGTGAPAPASAETRPAPPPARKQKKAAARPEKPARPAPRVAPERLREYIDWAKTRSHQVLFALLGFFAMLALATGIAPGTPAPRQFGLAALGIVGLLLFAGATEILQFVSLSRAPTWEDFIFDSGGLAVGVGAALIALPVLRRLRPTRRANG